MAYIDFVSELHKKTKRDCVGVLSVKIKWSVLLLPNNTDLIIGMVTGNTDMAAIDMAGDREVWQRNWRNIIGCNWVRKCWM